MDLNNRKMINHPPSPESMTKSKMIPRERKYLLYIQSDYRVGNLGARRYTYAPSRCRTSIAVPQDFYFPLSVSLFNGVALAGLRAGVMFLNLPKLVSPFCLLLVSRSLISLYMLVLRGWGL